MFIRPLTLSPLPSGEGTASRDYVFVGTIYRSIYYAMEGDLPDFQEILVNAPQTRRQFNQTVVTSVISAGMPRMGVTCDLQAGPPSAMAAFEHLAVRKDRIRSWTKAITFSADFFSGDPASVVRIVSAVLARLDDIDESAREDRIAAFSAFSEVGVRLPLVSGDNTDPAFWGRVYDRALEASWLPRENRWTRMKERQRSPNSPLPTIETKAFLLMYQKRRIRIHALLHTPTDRALLQQASLLQAQSQSSPRAEYRAALRISQSVRDPLGPQSPCPSTSSSHC